MKYPYRWTAILLSTLTFAIACEDDESVEAGPRGGASGSAGRAGGNAAPAGGAGRGGAGGSDHEGTAGEGGVGGAVLAGSAGESIGGAGGQGGEGGELAQPGHWLAFQLWTEDEHAHPLFVTGVPPQAEPVQVAADVGFWQWTPDGTRLIYATPANYGGPPNAAFSVTVSASGTLGASEPLHLPLGEGAYAWRVSIAPNSKTLALQLYEGEISTWYLRPIDGGVGDWLSAAAGSSKEPLVGVDRRLTWSPDGTRAAIVQREDATHDSLFIVDAATGKGSQGSFGTLRVFDWSADGSRLFAEVLHPDAGKRVLYAIDADAASVAVELSDLAVHFQFDPGKFAVSSDGDTVAFFSLANGVAAGNAFIKQVGSAQPAVQVVGTNPQEFFWSESSAQFLYTAALGHGQHLYAVPRQGGDAVRLNPEGTLADCYARPCLRAAGDALLFMTFDAGYTSNQLFDIDLSTSTSSASARPLTAFPAETRIDALAVAPDPSQVLLVTTDAAGKQGIYLVDRSTAAPSVTRLFNSAPGSYPTSPVGWSPDSRLFHLVTDAQVGGSLDLFTVRTESRPGALSAPLTPPGRKVTTFAAEWRPKPRP